MLVPKLLGHKLFTSKQLPEDWCNILDVTIMDADGFRQLPGRPENGPEREHPYYTEMHIDEFYRRYRECTVFAGN